MSKSKNKKSGKKGKYNGPRSSAIGSRRKAGDGGGSKGGNPIHVKSPAEFEKHLAAPEPVIIDFWAPWCGPCKQFGPIFDAVGKQWEGKVRFLKVNTEESPIANSFGIRSIPTTLALIGDEVVDSSTGLMSEVALSKMAQRLDDKVNGVTAGSKLKRIFGLGKKDETESAEV